MLTEEQLESVNSKSDSLLLIAGPGTGKSTVLVERTARLVEDGAEPEEIMIATFSRKAAESLRHRLAERHPDLAKCRVGTFHSLAFDHMSIKPRVIDEEMSTALLASCSHMHKGKAATQRDITERSSHPAMVHYLSTLNIRGEMDYTGLLLWMLENAELLFVKHLLVDEAQDNDLLQWQIVSKIACTGASVFCVMDPRQQIYEWRGGTYKPGLELRDTLYLTESFRLSPEIAELANRLAVHGVPDLLLKQIKGVGKEGIIQRNWTDNIDYLQFDGTVAVLCRTNRTVDRMSDLLSSRMYSHSVVRRQPKRLTGFIQYLASGMPPNRDILDRVIFPDLSGGENLARLRVAMLKEQYPDPVDLLYSIQFDTNEFQEEMGWWCRLARSGYDLDTLAQVGALHHFETEATSALVVGTIHQSKGLEYDVVIVPEEDYVGSREEHYRLSLVQVTRAKRKLIVCGSDGHLCREVDRLLAGD